VQVEGKFTSYRSRSKIAIQASDILSKIPYYSSQEPVVLPAISNRRVLLKTAPNVTGEEGVFG
jgi:hypothetical protein